MDEGGAIAGQPAGWPVPRFFQEYETRRWPEGVIDELRYPAMGVAQTEEDLAEIGRLRYELFIDRDGKRYAHANHETKTFLEPVDQLSLNFIARLQGRCAVAVRATWANDTIADPHLEQVVAQANLDAGALDRTIVNSRLAARPSMSARNLIPSLFQSMFKVALGADARFCIAATRPGLVSLFERFGFYPVDCRRPYFDEVAGWMSVLLLDLHDRSHLAKTSSPFLTVYDELISRNRERTRA